MAKPVRLTLGYTPGLGTPYLDIEFRMQGGEYDNEPISYRCWITERGTPVTMRSLLACGTNQDILELVPDAWLGSIESQGTLPGFGDRKVLVDIQLELDPRTGMESPRVRYVRPVPSNSTGSGGGREHALRALAAFRQRQANEAKAAPATPVGPEEEPNDDGEPTR